MIDAAKIGVVRDSEEFRTNTRRLAQFAEALADTNPAHSSGSVASPVFSHVPVMQSMVEIVKEVTEDFILHGEQDFHFHQPILPGQRLISCSRLIGIRNSSAGTLLFVRSETHSPEKGPICTQFATCLVQGRKSEDAGESPPDRLRPERNEIAIETKLPIAADQTARYADAARDYSPYTMDVDMARAVGLTAPIMHGMCTLAHIARPVVDQLCGGDTRRLKRLGCRFAHPLYLVSGQELTIRIWSGGNLFGFEASDRDGHTVVKNGFAEVTP